MQTKYNEKYGDDMSYRLRILYQHQLQQKYNDAAGDCHWKQPCSGPCQHDPGGKRRSAED